MRDSIESILEHNKVVRDSIESILEHNKGVRDSVEAIIIGTIKISQNSLKSIKIPQNFLGAFGARFSRRRKK